MSAQHPFSGFNFGIDTRLLATDSVVLDERDVQTAIYAIEAERQQGDLPKQGDVLNGLRYGIVLSAALWVSLLLGGFLLFT